MKQRLVILGAGSGLGLEIYKIAVKDFSEVFVISRKNSVNLDEEHFYQADFSKRDQWNLVCAKISEWNPTHVWYFAGGGPYGVYHEKKWSSHEWTFAVNFLFPAYLSHYLLAGAAEHSIVDPALQNRAKLQLQQLIFTGSKIAENQPDKGATSYSSSKHALKGFVNNLSNEYNKIDIRLFSPGYMKTPLLPEHSEPRLQGLALDPSDVAIQFINWSRKNAPKHLIF